MTDAKTLRDYHQLRHELRPTDIAIGLGSLDISVAEHTANAYHPGHLPLTVFTGTNVELEAKLQLCTYLRGVSQFRILQ